MLRIQVEVYRRFDIERGPSGMQLLREILRRRTVLGLFQIYGLRALYPNRTTHTSSSE